MVATAPEVLTLSFGEQVLPADAGVEVYDDRFAAVPVGTVVGAPGDPFTIELPLPRELARGTYTVAWRVSSGDTHPVAGSFRFSVGTPSPVQGTLPDPGRNEAAGALLGVLRWVGFVGAALGPGAVVGALVVWPAGLDRKRLRTVVATGLGLLVLSTAGAMLLQGVYASGQSLTALWRAPETLDSHSQRFDRVYAVRSYLLVAVTVGTVALLGLPTTVRHRWRRVWVVVSVVATMSLLATWPLVGHSAVPPGALFAVVVNLVHLGAMVLWLGGLTVVLVGLTIDRDVLARTVLPRFSLLALASVAVLVASGLVLGWRELGSVAALTGTTFGRVLLAKGVAVVLLLATANLARRWVARRGTDPTAAPAAPSGADWVPFRRGLVGEVALVAVILGLTAALVAIVPGRQAVEVPTGSPAPEGIGQARVIPEDP